MNTIRHMINACVVVIFRCVSIKVARVRLQRKELDNVVVSAYSTSVIDTALVVASLLPKYYNIIVACMCTKN